MGWDESKEGSYDQEHQIVGTPKSGRWTTVLIGEAFRKAFCLVTVTQKRTRPTLAAQVVWGALTNLLGVLVRWVLRRRASKTCVVPRGQNRKTQIRTIRLR